MGDCAQTREDIQEVIKRIKETTDLASYVGKFVVLKKEGGSLKGFCPFHEERSPSFSINQKNGGQYFHCFGCGKKGDVIDFVAGYDDCTVGEAIRKLRVGEDVAIRPMVQKPAEPIQIPITNAGKLQVFHQRLMASETGDKVLRYLGGDSCTDPNQVAVWSQKTCKLSRPISPGDIFLASNGLKQAWMYTPKGCVAIQCDMSG